MRTIQLPIVMAIVGLPLAITAATVVMRALAGLAAGRELFLIPHLEVSVSTAPDFDAGKAASAGRIGRILTVPRHRQFTKRIRHSIHCDENIVFLAIQPWFRQVLGPRPL